MRKTLIVIFSLLILCTLGFADGPDPGEFEAKSYDNAKVLRIKYTEGEAFLKRSYEEGFEEATVNLPVFEKDSVGTTEGRVEIYLGRMNYLRLDYDSEVEFERIPELRKTDVSIRILRGGMYLDIAGLDYERDVEIQTPDCGVFVLDKGLYRINVNDRGATEILVYEGMAEVSGQDYSRNVRENQKIVMLDGGVRERPFYFYETDQDDFDRWNRERSNETGYARFATSRYLDQGYEDYEYELSRSGRWQYHTTYREYIWIPYNLGSSWTPYYNGRWVWTPHYGYVWSSYDSWGYFTHHYGRWHYDPFYGWHWMSGYRWSPGWVYWFGDRHHYGWCPLGRRNRPVVVINKRWMRKHNYRRGIPGHARSAVIVTKGNLRAVKISKAAVNKRVLANKIMAGKGFAPKDRIAATKLKVMNARGKQVMYKKGAFLSKAKYKTTTPVVRSKSGTKKDTVYKYSGKTSDKKVFKYSKTAKSGAAKDRTTTPSKKYKYSGDSGSKSKSSTSSSKYRYKSPIKSKAKSSSTKSTTKSKYRSPSKSKYRSSSKPKSKSSSTRSKSKSKSSSKYKSPKKKKDSPSYYSPTKRPSYSSSSSSKYNSSSSSKSYSQPKYKSSSSSYSRPKYKSSSSSSSSTPRYKSSSSSSSYSRPKYKSSSSSSSSRSYSRPSSKSSSSSRSRSYSRPSSKSSSSSRSYSKPSRSSSRSSSKSYSRPSRSSKSSSSRSSRSSRSSSSKSSSSKSKKK